MALIREIERAPGAPGLNRIFWCPGCSCGHGISTREPGPVWVVSGAPERPTITPSVKIEQPKWDAQKNDWAPHILCHSVITDGRIHFELDCRHEFAGHTMAMVEF